ncbi:MAG: LamG-like jellyroll fold domain-containing protein, partial [Planctomycetota bacterium]|nr:LamG-like jellyroll fold domain-containing protein [Planctomycetota bacterium]
IVGGKDLVAVFEARTGKRIWDHQLEGRVFGLAYAGDRLLVSTDTGMIAAFAATAKVPWRATPVKQENVRPLLDVPASSSPGTGQLLHRWVFHRSAMRSPQGKPVLSDRLSGIQVLDQTGKTPLKLSGNLQSIAVGNSTVVESIETGKGMFPIDPADPTLKPAQAISASAWVRVDQPATWGGIIGCIQDDGSTEHGWLLGYNGNQFSFAVAGGQGGLTYLKAKKGFQKGRWYHVAVTYDGKVIKLYVDGKLSASSQSESGPISYSTKCFSTVAAYKDQNESYPLNGALHEVRLYDRVLPDTTIDQQFRTLKAEFKTKAAEVNRGEAPEQPAETFLTWGPYTKFIHQGAVELRYGTRQNCPTVVEIKPGTGPRRLSSENLATEHRIVVDKLPYKRTVQFQIFDRLGDNAKSSTVHEIDTHFDWSPFQRISGTPLPILSKVTNPRGMAFIF